MNRRPSKWHNGAESVEMVRVDNWVMARRPGCIPYTMFAKEWDALPSAEDGRKFEAEYRAAAQKGAR